MKKGKNNQNEPVTGDSQAALNRRQALRRMAVGAAGILAAVVLTDPKSQADGGPCGNCIAHMTGGYANYFAQSYYNNYYRNNYYNNYYNNSGAYYGSYTSYGYYSYSGYMSSNTYAAYGSVYDYGRSSYYGSYQR